MMTTGIHRRSQLPATTVTRIVYRTGGVLEMMGQWVLEHCRMWLLSITATGHHRHIRIRLRNGIGRAVFAGRIILGQWNCTTAGDVLLFMRRRGVWIGGVIVHQIVVVR